MVGSLNMGGAERFVVDLVSVQRAEFSMRILSLGKSSDDLCQEARELGCEVVNLGGLSRVAQAVQIRKALSGAKVLQIHSPWGLRLLAPFLPLIRLSSCKLVYTRHGAHAYRRWDWRVLHRLARHFAHAVTFVSQEGERIFAEVHGNWPRVQLIENGVRLDVATERPHGSRLRIGSVGRLVELKGQRHLLSAVSLLTKEEQQQVAIHFFGLGPEEAALRAQAQVLPEVEVHFHGLVLSRDHIYEGLDLLVVASRMEGLSLAIMEALARAIPVLATSVGGNGRLVQDGVSGVLVPPGNPEALREALSRLLADRSRLQTLGQGGRDHMMRHFSLAETASQYRALYDLHTPS